MGRMIDRRSPRVHFILALLISTLVSAGLFVYGAWHTGSRAHSYLVWNLFLAWLPFLVTLRLVQVLHTKLWSSWEALMLTIVWFILLPNSFYMISDFIHIKEVSPANVLYDAVTFTSFIYTGFLLGFSSLYLVHLELKRRFTARAAGTWIVATLLFCSFGIYIGRDLRWNSWDVLTNPAGLLFDVSDRLIHPAAYPQMLLAIVSFSVLLGSLYHLIWRGARLLLLGPRY